MTDIQSTLNVIDALLARLDSDLAGIAFQLQTIKEAIPNEVH